MTESHQHDDYLLGVNSQELERLRFQHSVWGHVTRKFLERLHVRDGWRCLDVGAGPGFVSIDLREMVGEAGGVIALEPSALYLHELRREAERRGWKNVQCIEGKAEEAALPACSFDLVFVRWVIAFVPDPEQFLVQLLRALRPGGVIAIEDYYYEGLSLFPRGGAWDGMGDIVRAYYRSAGGDVHVTGKIPAFFREHDLELVDFTPNCLAGGPTSGIMEWAHQFFTTHIPLMAEKGLISQSQSEDLLADWNAHRQNPAALFFSPLVVDVAGKLRA